MLKGQSSIFFTSEKKITKNTFKILFVIYIELTTCTLISHHILEYRDILHKIRLFT